MIKSRPTGRLFNTLVGAVLSRCRSSDDAKNLRKIFFIGKATAVSDLFDRELRVAQQLLGLFYACITDVIGEGLACGAAQGSGQIFAIVAKILCHVFGRADLGYVVADPIRHLVGGVSVGRRNGELGKQEHQCHIA